MRRISAEKITQEISKLCKRANFHLRGDVVSALKKARRSETNARTRRILDFLIENARIASQENLAICQDTGLPIVFVEIGEDLKITRGNLKDAINKGINVF